MDLWIYTWIFRTVATTTYGGRICELPKWMISERARFQWRTKKIQYLSKILSAVGSKTLLAIETTSYLYNSLVVIAELNI